ncbi:hypothetical protein [Thiolapillus sp.]|uniref:hypothetical protein n=1 Tax=Thiolapillus sp. TaxID=2017437 RepID=UPI003AF567F7
MTRMAGAQIGCQRPSRFWGLRCPKIYHEVEDTLGPSLAFNFFRLDDTRELGCYSRDRCWQRMLIVGECRGA